MAWVPAGSLHVNSVLQGRLEIRAPWATHLTNSGHAAFFVITGGRAFLRLDGQDAPIEVTAGSFVFVRKDQGYTILDSPETPVMPSKRLFASLERDAAGLMRGGGNGALTTALFGCFDIEDSQPLAAALPPCSTVREEKTPPSSGSTPACAGWLRSRPSSAAAPSSAASRRRS